MPPNPGGGHPRELRIIGLHLEDEIVPGADLAACILHSLTQHDLQLADGDVLAVTQKVVSKAEGRLVRLEDVEPSAFARQIAEAHGRDARLVEVVLRESRRIVKMDRGVLITETFHGLVCANSGVDASNVAGGGVVSLLPADPDASAIGIRERLRQRTDVAVRLIITDTFGRTWRNGLTNVAIGVAGLAPISSFAGQHDPFGYELRVTEMAVADELASAAELVMGKTSHIPFVLVRGFQGAGSVGRAADLVRAPEMDLFR